MGIEETSGRTFTREQSLRRAIEHIALGDSDAGARVASVVRGRIEDGARRVVITSDERAVPREVIEHAFDALRYSELVCVPDGSGDIALLGTAASHDALFAAIAWGTGHALDSLLRAAREHHVSVLLLPPTSTEQAGSQS